MAADSASRGDAHREPDPHRVDARARGLHAEARVGEVLRARGWQVVAQNWRGGGGELDSLNQVQVEPLVKVIKENRDLCVGIKVRLSADAANDGKNEKEAYIRALQACELAGVPLMTHHTFSTVPLTECPGADASPVKMRKGDLYTHTFHGFEVPPRPTTSPRTNQKHNLQAVAG